MRALEVRTMLHWIKVADEKYGATWLQAVGAGTGAIVNLREQNRLRLRRPAVVESRAWVGPQVLAGVLESA
jgi:hypothetical protein